MYADHFSGMGIGMWLFWILLVVIIVVIIKGVASNRTLPPPKEDPIEILKSRYARGEIDAEEFQHRLTELENKHEDK